MDFEQTMKQIKETNSVWLTRDIKAQLEKMIWETLIPVIDSEGNPTIEESSVSNFIDDLHTYYDVTERKDG